MSVFNIEFYYSILKPEYKEGKNMSDKEYPKEVAELNDGLYEAVLTRVSKYDLKDGRGSFVNFHFDINGTEFKYGQFLNEKTETILYRDFLIPLGMYASKRGLEECLNLKDLYVNFTKETNGKYTNIKFTPLFECKKTAPVGAKNNCIEQQFAPRLEEENFMDDDIPY